MIYYLGVSFQYQSHAIMVFLNIHFAFCVIYCVVWGETESTVWPIVQAPNGGGVWSSRWNENYEGKGKLDEEDRPIATLFTTNPKLPDWIRTQAVPVRNERLPA
jgi:hypothetical protein